MEEQIDQFINTDYDLIIQEKIRLMEENELENQNSPIHSKQMSGAIYDAIINKKISELQYGQNQFENDSSPNMNNQKQQIKIIEYGSDYKINIFKENKSPVQQKKTINNNLNTNYKKQSIFSINNLLKYSPKKKIMQREVDKGMLAQIIKHHEDDHHKQCYKIRNFANLLEELGLFYQNYDNNNQDQTITINSNIIEQQMNLCHQFWKILRIANLNHKLITSQLIFQTFEQLLDFKIENEECSNNLTEILQNNLDNLNSLDENNNNDRLNLIYLCNQNNLKWSIRDVVNNFRELMKLSISFKEKKNVVHNKLHNHHNEQKVKFQVYDLLKQKKELEQCTFQPLINSSSYELNSEKKLSLTSPKKENIILYSKQLQQQNLTNVHQKLYDQGQKSLQKLQEKQKIQEANLDEQMLECTFKPKINDPSKFDKSSTQRSLIDVKGINDFLDRKKKASSQKEYLDSFFKNQDLKISKVVKNKSQAQPLNLSYTQRDIIQSKRQMKQQQLLLYIDVGIFKGKQARIPVYQGDDPEHVVNEFNKIQHLNTEQLKKLKERVFKIFEIYKEQQQIKKKKSTFDDKFTDSNLKENKSFFY